MIESILNILQPIAETHHIKRPKDSETLPIIIFRFLDEADSVHADDETFDRNYVLDINFYSRDFSIEKAAEIEHAIKSLENCDVTLTANWKDKDIDDVYQFHLEFTIYQIN